MHIELDCKIVVDAISNSQIPLNKFGSIILNCIEELDDMSKFRISFIHRLANQVANCLARASRLYASSKDFHYIPNCIMLHYLNKMSQVFSC